MFIFHGNSIVKSDAAAWIKCWTQTGFSELNMRVTVLTVCAAARCFQISARQVYAIFLHIKQLRVA